MSAAECVCTPRVICSGVYPSMSVLPQLKPMHQSCLFSRYHTYSIHFHQLAVDFHWCNNQNALHTSKPAMVLADHPSLIWRNILMVSTQSCTNDTICTCQLHLQSHDTISCQTCCYLIFWKFLMYLSEVESSKYGTRNTSTTGTTTGMNNDMQLIQNNNHAVGVTDEVS